jgi:uncharacterized membrane protein YkoI
MLMRSSKLFAGAAAVLLTLGSVPAAAQRGDQDEAFEAARSGAIKPLGDIIRNVAPKVRGDFLGSDYDAADRTYSLKFMRDGSVVVVDVDARTGQVLGTRGK